jgi:hypothetical protein
MPSVDGITNPDGSVRTSDNTESLAYEQNKKAAFSKNGTKEVKGDNADRQMLQFEECKYHKEACKYIDIYGNCMAENCMFDQEETAPLTKKYWTICSICKEKFSVDPREMREYWCQSCLDRIHAREVLPFTCVHCGRKQNHPAVIPFSGICDYCFNHELFNDQYMVECYCHGRHTCDYHKKDMSDTPSYH